MKVFYKEVFDSLKNRYGVDDNEVDDILEEYKFEDLLKDNYDVVILYSPDFWAYSIYHEIEIDLWTTLYSFN